MVDGYRIRVVSATAGTPLYLETFPTEEAWSKSWEEDVITDDALSVYAGWGKIVVMKEKLSAAGNWETIRAEPMEVTP